MVIRKLMYINEGIIHTICCDLIRIGTLLDDIRNAISQYSQTPTQDPVSDHKQSFFPHTNTGTFHSVMI